MNIAVLGTLAAKKEEADDAVLWPNDAEMAWPSGETIDWPTEEEE